MSRESKSRQEYFGGVGILACHTRVDKSFLVQVDLKSRKDVQFFDIKRFSFSFDELISNLREDLCCFSVTVSLTVQLCCFQSFVLMQ